MVCGPSLAALVSVHTTKTISARAISAGSPANGACEIVCHRAGRRRAPGAQSKLSTRAPAPRPPLGSSSVCVAKTTRPGRRGRQADAVDERGRAAGRRRHGDRLNRPEGAGPVGGRRLQLALLRPGHDGAPAGPGRRRGLEADVGGERRGGAEACGPGGAARDDEPAAVPARQHGAAVTGDVEALQARALRAGRELLRRPAAADQTNSWRLLPVAGSASHATTRAPRSSWSTRTSSKECRLVAIVCGALRPTRSSRRLTPPAHALVEDDGHAVGPRVDAAQERLRAGERGHVPRRVGGSGRAQRHEGDAERGECEPWSWPWNVAARTPR